jgi:hypothetical protein
MLHEDVIKTTEQFFVGQSYRYVNNAIFYGLERSILYVQN